MAQVVEAIGTKNVLCGGSPSIYNFLRSIKVLLRNSLAGLLTIALVILIDIPLVRITVDH